MKKREGYRRMPERRNAKGKLLCLVPTCNRLRVKSHYSSRIRNYCGKHSFEDIFRYTSWSSLRKVALERDKYICKKCGFKDNSIYPDLIGDHIKPIALGGDEWDLKNVQTLCLKCNKIKTNEDMEKIRTARRNEKIIKGGDT